jgi:hypothetical protein
MTTVLIRDENATGKKSLREWGLELLTERISVRELIRSRVHQEVKDHNARAATTFVGLVRPTAAVDGPDGWRVKPGTKVDWTQQFERAVEAFETNRVLVLVNDRQATSLEEEIVVTPETRVTFLRLLPLVGG